MNIPKDDRQDKELQKDNEVFPRQIFPEDAFPEDAFPTDIFPRGDGDDGST